MFDLSGQRLYVFFYNKKKKTKTDLHIQLYIYTGCSQKIWMGGGGNLIS